VKAAGFHVEDEILAHDGETDEADVTSAHKDFRFTGVFGFSMWREWEAMGNLAGVAKLFCLLLRPPLDSLIRSLLPDLEAA
jgi:hypothetical protein